MPATRTSDVCVAGLTCGVLAAVLWPLCLVWFGYVSTIVVIGLAVAGIGLCCVGLRQTRESGHGMAVAGLVCAIVGLIPSVLLLSALIQLDGIW